jgi:predicted dienelactone hydrolase
MRTFRVFSILFVIAILAGGSLPIQAQGPTPQPVGLRPDAPPYALHEPYWVGVRESVIPDKEGKRPLPVTVWYPALNPDGKPEEWTIKPDYPPFFPNEERQGCAIQDAVPDMKGGPYPLVVFSPPHWTARYDTMDYTEHLASYGFVAIAVDHTGDTPANIGGGSFDVFVNRPRDISRVIDYAESLRHCKEITYWSRGIIL